MCTHRHKVRVPGYRMSMSLYRMSMSMCVLRTLTFFLEGDQYADRICISSAIHSLWNSIFRLKMEVLCKSRNVRL